MSHINVGQVIKDYNFTLSYDEEFDTYEPDEDRLLDHLEPLVGGQGNVVLDYHSSEMFPERWAGGPQGTVIVLSATTEVLYDRLQLRGYSARKVEENMDAEMHRVCEEEAYEAYASEKVFVFPNNSVEDMDSIVAFAKQRMGK